MADLAGRFRLLAVCAFGSRGEEIAGRVRGAQADARAGSDLDVGVLAEPGTRLTARERVELTIALEDLFDVPRVDLVVLPEADPFLALGWIRSHPDRIDRSL